MLSVLRLSINEYDDSKRNRPVPTVDVAGVNESRSVSSSSSSRSVSPRSCRDSQRSSSGSNNSPISWPTATFPHNKANTRGNLDKHTMANVRKIMRRNLRKAGYASAFEMRQRLPAANHSRRSDIPVFDCIIRKYNLASSQSQCLTMTLPDRRNPANWSIGSTLQQRRNLPKPVLGFASRHLTNTQVSQLQMVPRSTRGSDVSSFISRPDHFLLRTAQWDTSS